MKILKTAVLCILIVCLMFPVAACGKKRRTIDVISTDYPGLTRLEKGVLSIDTVKKYWDVEKRYNCFITEKNGAIVVENRDTYSCSSAMDTVSHGYFIGANTQSSGWVKWIGDDEERLIASERCLGFILIGAGEGYAITLSEDGINRRTLVRHLLFDYDKWEWTWDCVLQAEGSLHSYLYCKDDGCIFMSLDDGLYKFDLDGYELTLIKSWGDLADLWKPESIVKMNDKFFFGCQLGISEYIPAADEMYFYYVPYEKYVP